MKKCSKCKTEYENIAESFGKDSRRPDGFTPQCKKCKKRVVDIRLRKLQDQRSYAKNKAKVIARDKARKYYKGSVFVCSVLSCGQNADELHHVDYFDALAVVPLCKKHHRDNHSV